MKRYITCILTAALLLGCSKAPEQTKTTQAAPAVRIATAHQETYQPTLHFAGTAYAWQEANCGSVLPGKVEKIHAKEGQKVAKDELLAELSGELLAQAEIEYAAYKKDLERVTRLHQKGSVSEVDYDHLKAETEAKYERLQMLKKNTEIRAPFAGTVTEYLVQQGENYFFHPALEMNYSHAGGVVRLMQLDTIKIEIEVNEQDIRNLTPGMQANLSFVAYPADRFSATVASISPTLSHLTRTATATLRLANSDGRIKPGMFCKVDLPLPAVEAVMIPRTALLQLNGTGEYFVFTISGSQAQRTSISILQELNDRVAVCGLASGIQVITAGKQNCTDGMHVSILRED
jgi:membrane fusion protein (multidrug efflux system)